ncbi:PucC family protein [Rhodobacter capsulatus]|uniref:light-harvesting complex assembly protein PucC n=1 Tax=Rhodobacter capsulatus TaxID=1061 RepID=UPI0006DBF89E|nr:light-harvesting complex assembly protein PucC [Rhodobacter capsulatus]KQB12466.1 protein pucC [Rhodobacter capsulatus]KQB15984.1 protein pucC [Rhodobacter capsulatus]PZX26562.1 BCD family chlorophyll transporter-like MFS transporter [Rhodobacter capsulatus]QNR62038.1 PucC family protein [Rhodobacter capsulatus]
MGYRAFALKNLARHAPKYLPFADVASEEVPLSRLLRLSLFQITVGMTLTLLAGTLNRVMIVELAVPASLVSVMLAMPMLFAPFRTLIGFKSDTHKSALGLRRAPWIWKGTIYQFGGFAIMPFALLVLSGFGESVDAPRWIGMSAAALAFLLVGAGVHIVQTAGLALATDLVAEEDQPKVVGLMYVMLLFGMVISALVYGALLADYTPGRLIQVIQGTALASVVLNMAAMWKQEAVSRDRARQMETAVHPTFKEAFGLLMGRPGMLALLTVIALGTFGFGMADVLLEPYGGQALHLTVGETTKLTALFALGTLAGFGTASRVLGNGARPMPLAVLGALIGVPGFVAIIMSSLISQDGIWLFLAGTFAVGLGIGLFGHATLTATMRTAPADRIGLALGAWGAVQATAAGLGVALAGVVRDGLVALPGTFGSGVVGPYNTVFAIEALILIVAIAFAVPLLKRGGR